MTQLSITAPIELSRDILENQGRTVSAAAVLAWNSLPEHIRKASKKIRVAYQVTPSQPRHRWSIYYFFQLEGLPEFAVAYHTGNMGVPRNHYVLTEFDTEQLAKVLINGQSRMVDREKTLGLYYDIAAEVRRLRDQIDVKRETLSEFSPPGLEVKGISVYLSDFCLVRPTSRIDSPDRFVELCKNSGYGILDHVYVTTFDEVLKAKVSGVTDLAAMQHDSNHGQIMCVSLRNEAHPRYNVWTDGTGVFEQAISSQSWFIVKKPD
jgi:hypothetical protein